MGNSVTYILTRSNWNGHCVLSLAVIELLQELELQQPDGCSDCSEQAAAADEREYAEHLPTDH